MNVSDFQTVRQGELLVQLDDDDYPAQVAQASAAVAAGKAAIENNRRQKQLQQAKIDRALAGVSQAQAEISGAQAGIAAAQADLNRTLSERHRQESLIETNSTTRQKLEQVVAAEEGSRAQLLGRQASLEQAKAMLSSSQAAVDAERRGLEVVDSQELQLIADLRGKGGWAYRRTGEPGIHHNQRACRRHSWGTPGSTWTVGLSRNAGDCFR